MDIARAVLVIDRGREIRGTIGMMPVVRRARVAAGAMVVALVCGATAAMPARAEPGIDDPSSVPSVAPTGHPVDGALTGSAQTSSAGAWTLDQLVDRALRSNPRVLGQEEGQAAAHSAETAARWEFFPTPLVQVEGTRGDHLITSSLTQPLFAFGRLRAGLAAARAQARAAGFRTGETRQDLAIRVLELYGQFAGLTRQIAVFADDIDRHLALEAMIQRRVASGISAPVDLNLVQTRLNQSRITRTTLVARQRAVLAALSQVVGVPLESEAIGVGVREAGAASAGPGGDGEVYFADRFAEGELVQHSLDRNPGLQRAEAEIAAAEAETRRARSVLLPTVVARLENRSYTSGYPPSGLPTTRFTVELSLNTGAGLASLAGVQAAEARVRQVTLAREALRRDVTSTVIGALETFLAARRTLGWLRQTRMVQEQTADSYNRLFLAGKRSWLDVLNVVREQTGIERDLADAEVQLMVADFRLRIEAGDVA